MHAIWTLATKDILLLSRDRGGLFFTFLFPLLFALVFGAIYESLAGVQRGRIPITLVDEDQSAESRAFVERLREAPNLRPDVLEREKAAGMVRRGERPICVILPRGFGEALAQRPLGPTPVVEVGIDPARRAEAMLARGALTGVFLEEMRRGMASFDKLEPVRFETVDIGVTHDAPKNFYAVSFPQGMMWGVIGCTAAAGVSVVLERKRGTMRRVRIAPVTLAHVLAAKALACALLCIAVLVVLVLFAWRALDVTPEQPGLLLLGIISTAVAFVGVMILLSNFGRSELSAIAVCWGVLILLSMIGGGMVPFMAMPRWLQLIGTISPVRWALQALEGAIWRNYSTAEVLLPCAILWGFGLACFAVGVLGFRRLERA